jgi:hypothetical protein
MQLWLLSKLKLRIYIAVYGNTVTARPLYNVDNLKIRLAYMERRLGLRLLYIYCSLAPQVHTKGFNPKPMLVLITR